MRVSTRFNVSHLCVWVCVCVFTTIIGHDIGRCTADSRLLQLRLTFDSAYPPLLTELLNEILLSARRLTKWLLQTSGHEALWGFPFWWFYHPDASNVRSSHQMIGSRDAGWLFYIRIFQLLNSYIVKKWIFNSYLWTKWTADLFSKLKCRTGLLFPFYEIFQSFIIFPTRFRTFRHSHKSIECSSEHL